MKIFLSIKVPRGNAERESIISHLSKAISEKGHSPFVATSEIAHAGLTKPKDFMPFVRENLLDTDLFIVVYHPELRGGLIEVGIAYEKGIPIWLCHKADEQISSSMQGCADQSILYKDAAELKAKISHHLEVNDERR